MVAPCGGGGCTLLLFIVVGGCPCLHLVVVAAIAFVSFGDGCPCHLWWWWLFLPPLLFLLVVAAFALFVVVVVVIKLSSEVVGLVLQVTT